MNIGALNTDSLFSGVYGASIKALNWAFWGVIIIICISLMSWYLYRVWRNKTFYTTPITLTYIYENGTQKDRTDLVGGKFVNSGGVWDFRIKIPKQMKKKQLGYMPDFAKADSDGRINFLTSGDGTLWQQYEKKIVTKEVIKDGLKETEYELLIKPVPTDIKTVTVNSIRNWRETVDKTRITTFAIAIGAFIIMVIGHLISLYIQTKVKCGG